MNIKNVNANPIVKNIILIASQNSLELLFLQRRKERNKANPNESNKFIIIIFIGKILISIPILPLSYTI